MREIILALAGLSSGFGVAGGVFALIIALGIVSDFADRTHTAKYIFWYEDAVALGAIAGNLITVYRFVLPLGSVAAGIFGIFAGIFVGGWAMALTEIVNIVPIFSRRIDLRRGLGLVMISMALGRTVGSLIYYYYRW
jgi:stage V sporulation protein AB